MILPIHRAIFLALLILTPALVFAYEAVATAQEICLKNHSPAYCVNALR